MADNLFSIPNQRSPNVVQSSNKDRNYLDTSKSIIIPLWLRDTYAKVQLRPLYDLQGPLRESFNTEEDAQKSLAQQITGFDLNNESSLTSVPLMDSNIFISGGDVFGYLSRKIRRKNCNGVVTIVINSLRDLYWDNRQTLPREEVTQLEIALHRPLPKFKNIFEYKSLQSLSETIDLPLYQMFGTITPYSVIHIPIKYFVRMLNDKMPIQVALSGTNIIIQLDYAQYDFWDPISKSLIEYIDLSSVCPT